MSGDSLGVTISWSAGIANVVGTSMPMGWERRIRRPTDLPIRSNETDCVSKPPPSVLDVAGAVSPPRRRRA